MSQDSPPPIRLSVHERANPEVISPTPNAEMHAAQEDLNDAVPDQENVDVPIPNTGDAIADESLGDDQIMTANRQAG